MRAWFEAARAPQGGKPAAEFEAPPVSTALRVYTYELPAEFASNGDMALSLASASFYAIREFMASIGTREPDRADAFFVPINLIEWQFANRDPVHMLDCLDFLGTAPHLLVACGDFSNRSRINHNGLAYQQLYTWLDRFSLLAHESTSDLIPGRDIGIIPFHALPERAAFNVNERPFLYSFLGQLHHKFLPETHVRSRLAKVGQQGRDAFVAEKIPRRVRRRLGRTYGTADDYELVGRHSVFTLCPAGYGRWTYRLFQAVAWGSIPVLMSDDYQPPFQASIPYDEFVVQLPDSAVDDVDKVIRAIPTAEVKRLQEGVKRAQPLLTRHMFYTHLTRALERVTVNGSC